MDESSAASSADAQERFIDMDNARQVAVNSNIDHGGLFPKEASSEPRQGQFYQATDSTWGAAAARDEQLLSRPELKRDAVAPPPPLQPPPPAPAQQHQESPTSSFSLSELQQMLCDDDKPSQRVYAFEYADSQPFPEEIEEWFQYSEFDQVMLLDMKSSWESKWTAFCENQSTVFTTVSWIDAPYELRKSFMGQMLNILRSADLSTRIEALEVLCYAITGVWAHTAGKAIEHYPEESTREMATEMPKLKSMQIKWIEDNVSLLHECSGIDPLLENLSKVFDKSRDLLRTDPSFTESANVCPIRHIGLESEMNLLLTALYFVIEVGRRQEIQTPYDTPIRDFFLSSRPSILILLVEVIARLRWDNSASLPLTRIILLFWKSLLLFFGGSESLKRAKEMLEPFPEAKRNALSRRTPFLTASPLDYHLFRQEITSKYPAYNPPPPIVPLELENNSILPPLPQHPSRSASSSGLFSGVGLPAAGGSGSILFQPVHITTPVPSPPPSPIGPGGKTGKKQNYQTNQNFPFMYPPLDSSSNEIGGKGTAELQDILVGRKWEGSDVPASVIEAGKLFSSHVKMTRAVQQLWEERECFMKYDRGWSFDDCAPLPGSASGDDLVEGTQGSHLRTQETNQSDASRKETDDENIQRRLDAVELFYSQGLAHLQSITIVFLKIILANVSAMVNQGNGRASSGASEDGDRINESRRTRDNFSNVDSRGAIDVLDSIRLREITGKAISGSLLLLLKWFKRSHILKFEYMAQLLLDSNYIPLILKLFAHQDVDQAVAQRYDRDDLGFFHFCYLHSNQPPEEVAADGELLSGEDGHPSRRNAQYRSTPGSTLMLDPLSGKLLDGCYRPEVDELGYLTAPVPEDLVTEFSFRNFFSIINYLHIMQKITRNKSHRCLLLVHYRASAILREGLKVPDPTLRYYILKIFKSQVPYCGRKWRQGNMRVITAIYLYCRPELRDDWLAGSDVDAEVEEALPLEQALRGLTHWWHLRRYRDTMGPQGDTSLMEEERDFFARELEALDWRIAAQEAINGGSEEAETGGSGGLSVNGSEWDGGLQVEV